jgi:hypothetical protein
MRGSNPRVVAMFRRNAHLHGCADALRRSHFAAAIPHAIGMTFVLASSPAAAEVCDKIAAGSWLPAQAPAWLLNPFFPQLTVWAIVASGIAVTVLLRRRWVSYLAAVLFLLVAGVMLLEPPPGDPVRLAALHEGCASTLTMTLDAAILAMLAMTCIVLGHTMSRKRETP